MGIEVAQIRSGMRLEWIKGRVQIGKDLIKVAQGRNIKMLVEGWEVGIL